MTIASSLLPSLETALGAEAVLFPPDRTSEEPGPYFELRTGCRSLQWSDPSRRLGCQQASVVLRTHAILHSSQKLDAEVSKLTPRSRCRRVGPVTRLEGDETQSIMPKWKDCKVHGRWKTYISTWHAPLRRFALPINHFMHVKTFSADRNSPGGSGLLTRKVAQPDNVLALF